jgi:hypothetical protein
MRDTPLLVTQTVVVLAGAVVLLFGGTALLAQDASEKTSEPVYEVGNGVTAPKPVYTPDPEYSEKARKKKINGTVVVAMIVTREQSARGEDRQELGRRSRPTGACGRAHREIRTGN